ncbi:MAG: acyl-CoA thioesterase/BAAT N-terminal domain-containing protein, partial [Allosphingosinicella sp.]
MWLKRVVLGIALTTFCVRSEAEPRIRVAPIDVIEGEPVQVVVEGLQPGQSVTLRTSRLWPAYPSGEEQVSAWASFTADAEGIVDLGKREPLAGSSYQGTDASGLFWSMSRQPDSILAWSDGQGLRAGRVVIEAESQGRIVART